MLSQPVVLWHAATQDVAENRAEYRSMCFATPGLSEHIGGVILHWETLFQKDAEGKAITTPLQMKYPGGAPTSLGRSSKHVGGG